MKKIQQISLLLITSILTITCGSSQKTKPDYVEVTKISYKTDVEPIITRSCSPCHIPPKGKKEPLDNYTHVKENIDAILRRINLPKDNRKFMPPVNKKPALTESEMAILANWQAQNMPE